MRPLALVLIVVIPWTALVTVALALRKGRPPVHYDWTTERIQHRMAEIDAEPHAGRELRRERERLWRELFRRGRAHDAEGQ